VEATTEDMIERINKWRNDLGEDSYATHHDVTIAASQATQNLGFLADYMCDSKRRDKIMVTKKRERITAPLADIISTLEEMNAKMAGKPRAIDVLDAITNLIQTQLAR